MRLFILGCLCCSLSASGNVWASEINEVKRAPTNKPGSEFPQVDSNRRVTFRVHAPNADSVQVVPGGRDNGLGPGPFEMVRDEDGYWSVTTPPAVAGFHYYWLSIDGFECNDSGTRTFFGWNKECSGIDVRDRQVDFYDIKDTPHGHVESHWYYSDVTRMWRRAMIYTPPDYDRRSEQRYPVLYLQHGAGESERGWTEQGHANFILDNLIAEGNAEPMIVVMENGMVAPRPDGGETNERGRRNQAFGDMVMEDLIPEIDRAYRTKANRDNRAIAGLSMGAGQALRIGLGNPQHFAYVGCFSGGRPSANSVKLDPSLKLFWAGAGTVEAARFSSAKAIVESAREMGIKAVWYESQGTAHEWQTWRHCLHEFAPLLFNK